jgi:non-specific serine/threonine protein kinase/serine/threonine-protein kinase
VETSERWKRVKEIVGNALETPAAERSAYLDSACSGDFDLRAEAESLLAAHADAADLSRPPWEPDAADGPTFSQTVGPYKLVRILGVGGMGQVWLAEQTEPVRRTVALKLIRAGMYDASIVKRFQSERQSLAMMDHPAIAKVFDASATPAGQPYLVMEYVDGLPITDYCDLKKLNIRDRLKLFIEVCEGVKHAHQKAIIHRDLKPSNILVVEVDGKPRPRIIDFGLAKAAVAVVPGETLITHVGGFLGTPGYMSPEQADPEVQGIDTRTDVYSLGVVLYELLTGFLPFDTAKWKNQRIDEMLRALRESDPQRPSTKVSANRHTSTAQAEMRGTETRQLVGALRGDLDWITLKALERERDRRYGTPSELAADIERYLQNLPVMARPASAGYRLRKFVRRNGLVLGISGGLAVLLIAFAVMQTIQVRRITRERDRADRITEFMTNMFRVSDPSEARGNTITAREVLDRGSQQVEAGLARDPEVQARLMETMGEVYSALGLYQQAQPFLEKALATRRRLLGTESPETLRSIDQLARDLERQGHYPEAESIAREALAIRQRLYGPEARDTLMSIHGLGAIMLSEGHYTETEQLDRKTLEVARRVLGPEDPGTLKFMANLALAVADQGRTVEAEKLYKELLDIQRHVYGPQHPETLITETTLAHTISEEGRYAEADQMLRDSLDIKKKVLGPEHSETLWSMADLGMNLRLSGRLAEAEKLDRQTLEIRRRVLGLEHPETLMSTTELAETLDDLHRYPEAAELYRQTIDVQRRVVGADHPVTALTKYNLACNLALSGHHDEAFEVLRDSVEHGLPIRYALNAATDSDLQSIQKDPRFAKLMEGVQLRAKAKQTGK